MAITVVQSIGTTHTTGAASLASATFGSSITGGNTIIVCVATEDGAGSGVVTGATDSNGNTYTIDKQVGPSGSNDRVAILSVSNATGGASNVITVTTTGNCFLTILGAIEVSGLATSSPVDAAGGQTGTVAGTGQPGPGYTSPFSTTNANDLLVTGYASNQALSTSTVPASFTRIGDYLGATFENGDSAYEIVSSTQSGINPTFDTHDAAGQWACAIVAYKQASAGGAGSNLLSLLGAGS